MGVCLFKRHFPIVWVSLLSFYIFSASAFAAHFRFTSPDPALPSKCKNITIESFVDADILKTFSISTLGGVESGFTFEYPIAFEEAVYLAVALRPSRSSAHRSPSRAEARRVIHNSPYLTEVSSKLRSLGRRHDSDFSGGKVLELLAYDYMKNFFPESEYFITGGIEYMKQKGKDVLGELDVVIGRLKDCKVIAIGEAKFDPKRIEKATEQLNRASNFIAEEQKLREHYRSLTIPAEEPFERVWECERYLLEAAI